MSIDETILKLLTGMADVASALRANAEATDRNTAITERVVAFQEQAIAANAEGGKPATARKPRQTAAEKTQAAAEAAGLVPSTSTPAAGEQPAAATTPEPEPVHVLLAAANGETKVVKNPKTGTDEDTPTANYRASDFSRDQVKNEFIGWLGDTTDADERKARAAFVAAIGQHFGVAKPFDPTNGLTDDDQRKQTLFFLRRKREGLAVDFGADYDFDGDPLADQSVDAVEDEDEDALG